MRAPARASPTRKRGGVRERCMSVIEALLARATKGMSFGLDATRNALRAIGEPQNAVPVVHVAGSNGKGSTAAMVAELMPELKMT